MSLLSRTLVLPFVILVAACGASATDDAGGEATSALYNDTWVKIADCDDGAAVVDVNEGERRELQLVIRNRAAADYLLAHGNDYMRGMQKNAKGELILSGATGRGVFSSRDYWMFRGYGNQQYPIYDVYPDRSGGVRVSILGNDRQEAANWWFPGCK